MASLRSIPSVRNLHDSSSMLCNQISCAALTYTSSHRGELPQYPVLNARQGLCAGKFAGCKAWIGTIACWKMV